MSRSTLAALLVLTVFVLGGIGEARAAQGTEKTSAEPADEYEYNARGIAHQAKHEYDKAIADFNEAIERNPSYFRAIMNRGHAWTELREYDKAIADFDRAAKLRPDLPGAMEPLINLGSTRRLKGDYDNALKDFDSVVALSPRSADGYWMRGMIQHARKAYDKALADFDQSILLNNASPNAYDRRAWLLATCPDAMLRDGPKAVESALRAEELSKRPRSDHAETLAAAYAEVGDFDKAVKMQELAIKLHAELLARQPQLNPNNGFEKQAEERLTLYKNKMPVRD